MTWRIELEDHARRQLRKLSPSIQDQITRYLRQRLATDANPCRYGKALTGDYAGLWRYRVGDYRIICDIKDDRLIVLVVTIGHRKLVYQ